MTRCFSSILIESSEGLRHRPRNRGRIPVRSLPKPLSNLPPSFLSRLIKIHEVKSISRFQMATLCVVMCSCGCQPDSRSDPQATTHSVHGFARQESSEGNVDSGSGIAARSKSEDALTPRRNEGEGDDTKQEMGWSDEVEGIYASRLWEFRRKLRIKESRRAELETELEAIEERRPKPPEPEMRTWRSVDGAHATQAVFVAENNGVVKLRKADGKTIEVDASKLSWYSRNYIATAANQHESSEEFQIWKSEKDGVTKEIATLSDDLEGSGVVLDLLAGEADSEAVVSAPFTRRSIAEELRKRKQEDLRKREEHEARMARAQKERDAAEKAKAERSARSERNFDGVVLIMDTVKLERNSPRHVIITGIVENRRQREIRYAQITFSVYDRDGNKVGTALANISRLEPEERWRFEASYFGDDYARYEFSDLTVF